MAYEYLRQSDSLYVFTTKNENDYVVLFRFADEYFQHTCTHCNNIHEVCVICINNEHPEFDIQTMETVAEIIRDFTVDGTTAAVMYKCSDIDGRGCSRELRFERAFENADIPNFEYYSHTYIFDETIELKYNLIASTTHEHYHEIVDEFYAAPNFWFQDKVEIPAELDEEE